jgi:hypothetical protein
MSKLIGSSQFHAEILFSGNLKPTPHLLRHRTQSVVIQHLGLKSHRPNQSSKHHERMPVYRPQWFDSQLTTPLYEGKR